MKLRELSLLTALCAAAGCSSTTAAPAADGTTPSTGDTATSAGSRETDTMPKTTAPEASTTPTASTTTSPITDGRSKTVDKSEPVIDWARAERIIQKIAAAFQGTATDCASAAATIENIIGDNAVLVKEMSGIRGRRPHALGQKYMTTPAVQEGLSKCIQDKAFKAAIIKLRGGR